MENIVAKSACLICGSSNTQNFTLPYPSLLPITYEPSGNTLAAIFLCKKCGTIFRPELEEPINYYVRGGDSICEVLETSDSQVTVFYEKERRYVSNHYAISHYLADRINTPCPRILDVGCGLGLFLKELREQFQRFTLAGFDIEELLSDQFKKYQNISYFCGNLDKIPGTFDVITLIDSLSYIKDVNQLFEAFDSKLTDEGFIFITTPDISKNHIHLLLDAHYCYFSPESLAGLFEYFGYGFKKIEVNNTFPRHVFGWAQKGNVKFKSSFEYNQRVIKTATDYLQRLDRNLYRIARWWKNSATENMRLGILGTRHNAAISMNVLSPYITFIADENEGRVQTTFLEKTIIHPRELSGDDFLLIPYGATSNSIRDRFLELYSGRFICI